MDDPQTVQNILADIINHIKYFYRLVIAKKPLPFINEVRFFPLHKAMKLGKVLNLMMGSEALRYSS